MNIRFQKLIKILKTSRLGLEDKTGIRGRLLSYMTYHPARDTETQWQQPSPYFTFKHQFSFAAFRNVQWRYVPLALVLALGLSGSLSLAAEGALPGEVLYPIKTAINEEVVSLVTVKTKSKAQWEGRRAERRLEEAKELVATGKLTSDNKTTIETKIKQHTANAAAQIAELKQESKVEALAVSTEVEAKLRVGEQALTEAASSTTGTVEVAGVVAAASSSAALIADNKAEIVKEAIVEAVAAATTTPLSISTTTAETIVTITASTTASSTSEQTGTKGPKEPVQPATSTELPRNDSQADGVGIIPPEAQEKIEKKVLESLQSGTIQINLSF